MYQVSVFVHILSAVVWVGGLLFLALVVVPATRPLPAAERGALISAIGQRFRPVGWACILLLLTSGVVIAGYRGVTPAALLTGQLLTTQFGWLLLVKLGLVAAIVALSLVHDVVLGPASARLLTRGDTAAASQAARLRRHSVWTARVSALLSVLVIGLAVALVRGLPW